MKTSRQYPDRAINLSSGPSALPTPVLEKIQTEVLSYQGTGVSVMEMSHRSHWFDQILEDTKNKFKTLNQISDEFEVLFLHGGASHHFCYLPMNFCSDEVALLHTGYWIDKAIEPLQKLGKKFEVLCSGENSNFRTLPTVPKVEKKFSYIHMCSNNTIEGTQWKEIPKLSSPLVIDMSSDILSRDLPLEQSDFIFAGAQKNLSIAGLTVCIIRKTFLESIPEGVPNIFNYAVHAKEGSRYHTCPTFPIYIAGLVLDWIKEEGGISEMKKRAKTRSSLVYDFLDQSKLFQAPVEISSRSMMNLVFQLRAPYSSTKNLESEILEEAKKIRIFDLKGHRSSGAFRASLYNAQSIENTNTLVKFLESVEKKYV